MIEAAVTDQARARAFYDAIAEPYAAHFEEEFPGVWGRAVLGAFAELARPGPVADVGCGPGWVAAHLHALGCEVFGIDLSPGMVAVARRRYPAIRFTEGSMNELDVPDGSLTGLVAWYSTIHVADDALPGALAGFRRALAPDGYLLLAFQVGDVPLELDEAFGHPVSLTFRRRRPDRVAALLADAGFAITARLERGALEAERTPHAYLMARAAVASGP